jgi:hypothetical protein
MTPEKTPIRELDTRLGFKYSGGRQMEPLFRRDWFHIYYQDIENIYPLLKSCPGAPFGRCPLVLALWVVFCWPCAYQGKDIVFRFIIEYSSFKGFWPLRSNNNTSIFI